MAMYLNSVHKTVQLWFHDKWGHLNDPHVRSLAWLLEAPDLLAYDAPQWQGKIGALSINPEFVWRWLSQLDASPQELHAWLNVHHFYRLGRYAERLMSFYFQHDGSLIAHGVQLKDPKQRTIGEFDFLVRDGTSVLHLELATKFYLLNEQAVSAESSPAVDYFIGPNLADTLGTKMRKIIDKQLMLGRHPAARTQLPEPVADARALIKGWLFYRGAELPDTKASGLSKEHCRGFWCTTAEIAERPEQRFLILPRLSWLAPAKAETGQVMTKECLLSVLKENFRHAAMPVLVAIVDIAQENAIEMDRGFVVPDDWQMRAGQRRAHT